MAETITHGAGNGELLPIGRVARELGVSERTLRYYEEIGLVVPSSRNPGQHRRYAAGDVERIIEIRELQAVMGYSLEEIQAIFRTRERFESIRAAYRQGVCRAEQARLLEEAAAIMDDQRRRVRAKVERLEAILADLDDRSERYHRLHEEITATIPA